MSKVFILLTMSRKHFQQFHNSEPRIKRCLRCLLNEKADIIDKQNRKINDLRHYLEEEEYRSEQLLDKIEELRNELSIALDAKSYYKHKSKRNIN